ncbi:MAG: hypothetical protein NVV63_14040 [Opitutus sp.]|nr:hypothetical protein [Opitutus sp.]
MKTLKSPVARSVVIAAFVAATMTAGCRPHDGDPKVKETDRQTMYPEGQRQSTGDEAKGSQDSQPENELTRRPSDSSGGTQTPGSETSGNADDRKTN